VAQEIALRGVIVIYCVVVPNRRMALSSRFSCCRRCRWGLIAFGLGLLIELNVRKALVDCQDGHAHALALQSVCI
jgi:hypothetical protein